MGVGSMPDEGVVAPERTSHALGDMGVIRDWLVSPAWSWPCADLGEVLAKDGPPWGPNGRWVLTNSPEAIPLKERLYELHSIVTDQVLPHIVEGGEIAWKGESGTVAERATWRRRRTGPDGLVDWSEFCYLPTYRQALAAALLEIDQREWRAFEISSTGPVAVWLDGKLVESFAGFSYQVPVRHEVRLLLASGCSELLVATWQVAFREVRHVARVAISGLPVRVVIPSPGADERASALWERVLDSVGIDAWAARGATAELSGPVGAALRVGVGDEPPTRVVLEGGSASVDLRPKSTDAPGFSRSSMLTTGEMVLSVGADDDRVPVRRELRAVVLPPRYRGALEVPDPEKWRRELLDHVANTAPSIARAIASVALGAQGPIRVDDLTLGLDMINQRADCADFQAVGLMRLWNDVPDTAWPEGLRDSVRDAVLGFKYWIDQPGLDAMCYFTENHQLVYHTAEMLAGEAFASDIFTNTGWSGAKHTEHGREFAREWLWQKLAGGFSEFDSNAYMAIDSLALVSLVDYSADVTIRSLAEAVLDKMLFTLACNSWHGIHGAAHGRSYTQMLRSSRFDGTAPIMWTLFGTGTLNNDVLPPTALATSKRYCLPELIRSVATDFDAPWWGRQVYRGNYRFTHDLRSRPYHSDVRVWRTADAMLSSVQDYRSGLPGLQEHIFGATLAPEVQVFATLPASGSDSSNARPNAWAGELVLPRARQHRDSVLVVYPSLGELPRGSTHVWFPAALMDEVLEKGPWLVGRVAKGYAAIACAGGLRPLVVGPTRRQEWLPNGDGSAYVVTVGSEEFDGPLERFVAALGEPDFSRLGADPAVSWTARDGTTLALSWSGGFLVGGLDADLDAGGGLSTETHIDNPACTVKFGSRLFVAEHKGRRLVIDLKAGTRVEPISTVGDDGSDV